MKKIIILFLAFQSFLLMAQEPPKMLKYSAVNAANIFYYQIDEVPGKIKVKKEKIENATKSALRKYNNKIKDISFLNSQKLKDLEVMVNAVGNQARTNPDLGRKLRKSIETTILPIRDSIDKFEKTLNGTLVTVLSKKQYKKWIKYQKNEKRKLLPKRPKRSSAPPTNRTRRGGRGGRGGGF
jgi:hypothetical protein